MEKTSTKFRVIIRLYESCPWCNKRGILASTMKKSVMRVCVFACGYVSFTPKELLSFKERIKFFDPKRFRGGRSKKLEKLLLEKFDDCVRRSRRHCLGERYSRRFKEESKRSWLERLKSGTVSLPKDTDASGHSGSSTSSLTQSNNP